MDIEVLSLGSALVVIASIFIYTLLTGISPMPTSAKVCRAMLDILPNNIDGAIFDLGSGWGTLAIPLARQYPNCPVYGYEISPLPWFYSYLRKGISGFRNLRFHRYNYLKVDLSAAAIIVVYIHADGMEILKSKFEHELKPGTLIVSNFFQIRGWEPIQTTTVDDIHQTKVYLYQH